MAHFCLCIHTHTHVHPRPHTPVFPYSISPSQSVCWLCCQEAAKWCLHQLIPLSLLSVTINSSADDVCVCGCGCVCVCWKHLCYDIWYICAVGVLRRERKRTNWRPGYKCSLSLSYHLLGIWFIMADGHWTGTAGVAMATQLRRTEHLRLERRRCLSPAGDAASRFGKSSRWHTRAREHVFTSQRRRKYARVGIRKSASGTP